MALIDLDKFVESLMWMWSGPETATFFNDLKLALDKQGLAYKDGKIIKTQRRISAEAKETGYGEPEDKEKPNGGIVLEDFNEGDGFYKVNLAYLSKEQVEEIENIAKKWNPELAESEDERIRKSLLRWVKSNSYTNIAGIQINDVITWLEKQGNTDFEFFENGENEKREFVGYGFLKCKGDFLSFKEGETYWLEYVGKDNYNVRSDNLLGQTFHITPQQLYTVFRPTTWLEKQGKQNPADKIEPKFHEGDWIISNTANEDYRICKITDINNGYYTIESIYGYKGYNHFNVFEESYRLWTIQDAKEGDVLVASDESLFIFAKTKDNAAYYHYSLCKNGSQEISDGKHSWETASGSRPATKEQRDMLFQKMHEAGYTFDFEKKELKKLKFRVGDEVITENEESLTITRIDEEGYWSNDLFICDFDSECVWDLVEKKPTEWSLPYGKNETAEKLIALAEILELDGDCLFNGVSGNSYGKFLRVLAKELTEVKPAWSEEDETKIKSIIAFLKSPSLCAMNGNKGIIDANIKYLKSLKDRVQPQPKQEWKQENREELTEFENAMMHIGGSFFGENAGLDPNDTDTIKEQAKLLLELAPKQKWSEEDEEMIEGLNNCLDELEKENGWRYIYVNSKNVELNKVRNWLKSFKKE